MLFIEYIVGSNVFRTFREVVLVNHHTMRSGNVAKSRALIDVMANVIFIHLFYRPANNTPSQFQGGGMTNLPGETLRQVFEFLVCLNDSIQDVLKNVCDIRIFRNLLYQESAIPKWLPKKAI